MPGYTFALYMLQEKGCIDTWRATGGRHRMRNRRQGNPFGSKVWDGKD